MSPDLGGTTFSGTPAQLRERLAALAEQGVGELIYAPMGPDVPAELPLLPCSRFHGFFGIPDNLIGEIHFIITILVISIQLLLGRPFFPSRLSVFSGMGCYGCPEFV